MSVEEQTWAVEGDSWSPSWADSADEELVREYGVASGGPRFAVQDPDRPVETPHFERSGDVWTRSEATARGEAVLMCAGSLLYDRALERMSTAGDRHEFRSLFSRLRACFESADLAVGSLGAVVADMYPPMSTIPPKYVDGHYTNAPSAFLDAIRYAGFDCLALSNPYNLDAGVRGISSTEREVDAAGLVASGLGRSKNPVFEVNGIRIGVLSTTVNAYRTEERITSEGVDRLLNVHSSESVKTAVDEMKAAGAEFVLNYFDCRSSEDSLDLAARKEQAIISAEAGVDYVVCIRPPLVSRRIVHTTADGRKVPIATGIGALLAGPKNYLDTPSAILRIVVRRTGEGSIEVDDSYIPTRRFRLYKGLANAAVPAHRSYNPDFDQDEFADTLRVVGERLGSEIRIDPSRTVTIDSDLRPQITPAEIADILEVRFSRSDVRSLREKMHKPVTVVAVQKEHLVDGCAAVLAARTIAGVVPGRIRPGDPAAAGAAMAIAKESVPGVPTLIVDDPGAAFIRIASAIRRRYSPVTVAVTGSAGKTTAVEMVTSVMKSTLQTLVVKGNYNTPRGGARMIQKLSDEDEAYIQEVHGGSPGTARVASRMLRPDIALITSIGDAHLQQLGTIEKVIEAKMQIADGLAQGGVLILNDDNEYLRVQNPSVTTLRYSTSGSNADYAARDIRQHDDTVEFDIVHPDGIASVLMHIRGLHNVSNALGAFAVAHRAGVPVHAIVAGLSRYRTRSVRQNLVDAGGYRLYIDAYNSNPLSLRSAVSTFCDIPVRDGARRVAVLGDMGEQGTKTVENHTSAGEYLAGMPIDLVLSQGEGMAHTAEALRAAGAEVRHSESVDGLIADVRDHLRPGDLVLFKAAGSVDLVRNVVYPVFGKVV